jgi:hypothetical protein
MSDYTHKEDIAAENQSGEYICSRLDTYHMAIEALCGLCVIIVLLCPKRETLNFYVQVKGHYY